MHTPINVVTENRAGINLRKYGYTKAVNEYFSALASNNKLVDNFNSSERVKNVATLYLQAKELSAQFRLLYNLLPNECTLLRQRMTEIKDTLQFRVESPLLIMAENAKIPFENLYVEKVEMKMPTVQNAYDNIDLYLSGLSRNLPASEKWTSCEVERFAKDKLLPRMKDLTQEMNASFKKFHQGHITGSAGDNIRLIPIRETPSNSNLDSTSLGLDGTVLAPNVIPFGKRSK